MFNDYQVVRLSSDVPEAELKAGSRGTVLMVYPWRPPAPQEYEVEFLDQEGMMLAILTLTEELLEAVPDKETVSFG